MKEVFEKIIEKLNKRMEHYDTRNKILLDAGEVNAAGRIVERMAEIDFAKNVVNQVSTEYNNGWIPVKERLPEITGRYLVTALWEDGDFKKHSVYDAVYGSDGIWHVEDYAPAPYKVLAWQPLPESYQPSICTNTDCPYNEGKECPAAEGCAGRERGE